MNQETINDIANDLASVREKSKKKRAVKQIADTAQMLDSVLLNLFEYEKGDQSAAWINNQGLNTIPEDIFLKPWMQFEFHNLTALWKMRNQMFEFINEAQNDS